MNKPLSPFRLTPGQTVIFRGKEYRVFGKTRAGWALTGDGIPAVEIADTELLELLAAREISFIANTAVLKTAHGVVEGTQCIAVQDEASWKEASLRVEYVLMLEATARGFRTGHRFQQEIDDLALKLGDKDPPKPRTVREWARTYRKGCRAQDALVKQSAKVSLRRKRRADAAVDAAVHKYFGVYLKTPNSVRGIAIRDAQRELEQANATWVPCPKYFYRRFDELEGFGPTTTKFGKHTARRMRRHTLNSITASRPLELVLLDSTTLDVFAAYGKKGKKRPFLTLVIDVYSRFPIGYYLGFRDPSSWTSIEALKCAILPKDWVQKHFPELGPWLAQGMMEGVGADNGRENLAVFVDGCNSLAIDYYRTPVKTPWANGIVERLIGRCNQLLQKLPGSVGSDPALIYEKGGMRDDCLTLKQIERELLRIIIEEMQNAQHTTLGDNPGRVWLEGVERFKVRPPCNIEKLDMLTGEQMRRSASPNGIKYDGIRYNGVALEALRLRDIRPRHPDETDRPKYTIMVYENDITHIKVFNEVDKHFYTIPAIEPDLYDGLSRGEHQLIRSRALKHAKKRHPGSEYRGVHSRDDYLRAKKEILSIPDEIVSVAHREVMRARPTRLTEPPSQSVDTTHLLAGEASYVQSSIDISNISSCPPIDMSSQQTDVAAPKPAKKSKAPEADPTPISADQFTTLDSE